MKVCYRGEEALVNDEEEGNRITESLNAKRVFFEVGRWRLIGHSSLLIGHSVWATPSD